MLYLYCIAVRERHSEFEVRARALVFGGGLRAWLHKLQQKLYWCNTHYSVKVWQPSGRVSIIVNFFYLCLLISVLAEYYVDNICTV